MRGREHTCTTTYIHIHWRHEKLVKTQHFYYIIVDNNYVRDIEWAARDRHRRFDWSRNFRFRRQHLNSSNLPGGILVLVLNHSNTKTTFFRTSSSLCSMFRWTFILSKLNKYSAYFFSFTFFLQNVIKFQIPGTSGCCLKNGKSTYTLWTVNDVLGKDPEGPNSFLGKMPKLAVFPAKAGAEKYC